MPKASEVKRGEVVRHKENVYAVRKIEIRTPSSRGSNTLYRMKLQDVQTRQNIDETFKGEDTLGDVDFIRRQASYSYFDGELYVFMDDEDYSQYAFNETDLEGQLEYLSEGLGGIFVTLIDGVAAGIQLPPSVDLEIVETAPMLKGGTATKRSKPATLAGGLEVLVPEFIETGEVIKVNTETGEYMSRA
ncbi:MAG: elongation factor P-like protein YeiP [Xanthomonadales bacterium]|nr:elongation factor P-like protein YeiP [Xanthomonadales bacterium]